jgi:hypothetical protein
MQPNETKVTSPCKCRVDLFIMIKHYTKQQATNRWKSAAQFKREKEARKHLKTKTERRKATHDFGRLACAKGEKSIIYWTQFNAFTAYLYKTKQDPQLAGILATYLWGSDDDRKDLKRGYWNGNDGDRRNDFLILIRWANENTENNHNI